MGGTLPGGTAGVAEVGPVGLGRCIGMSEPTAPQDSPLDDYRQHAEAPAEGPDEEQEDQPDVPRVHPEDPAEG